MSAFNVHSVRYLKPHIVTAIAAFGVIALPPAIRPAFGQPPAPPAFDVVSIKVSKPDATGSNSNFSHDTYSAGNVTLKEIIEYDAYEVPGPQILGIPRALEKIGFDIQAKLDPAAYARLKPLSSEQSDQMVRQLLADGFKLAVHKETRELPVYALTIAKNGPKLEPAKDPDGGTSFSGKRGQLTAKGTSTAELAAKLTRSFFGDLGRIVIDKTNLTGRYDLTLKWTPDIGTAPTPDGQPDTSAPSIFTAIQEQLGLKLESAKGPVPVLVVDHAEMPSGN